MKKIFFIFPIILLNINLAAAQTNLDLHIYNNTKKSFIFNLSSPVTVAANSAITISVPFQKQDTYHQYIIMAKGFLANGLRLNVYGPPKAGNESEFRISDIINLWGDRKTSNGAQYAARSWDFRWEHLGLAAEAYIMYDGTPTWPYLDTINITSKNDGQNYYYSSQASKNTWHNQGHSLNTFGILNSIYYKKQDASGAAGAIQGYTNWNGADVSFTWYKTAAGFTPLGQKNKGDTTGYDVIINSLPPNQTNFGEAYIFGDSLSDNHIVYDGSYGELPKGPFYDGRWTNGLNWVDQLQKATGLPILDFAFGGADIRNMIIENKDEKELAMIGVSSGMPRVPNLEQEIFASAFTSPDISTKFNSNVPATGSKTTTTAKLFKGPSAYQYIAHGLSNGKRIAIFVLMGANDFWHQFHQNNPSDSKVQALAVKLAKIEIGDLAQINLNLTSVASQAKYRLPLNKNGKYNLPKIYVLTLPNLALVPSYNNAVEPGNFSKYLNNALEVAVTNYNTNHRSYNNLHIIPLYGFVQAIANDPTLFGYSSASISDPSKASIFGTWSIYPKTKTKHANDFNFMGAQGDKQWHHIPHADVHEDIRIFPPLAYQQAVINQFIFAGKMHPSAKTHALISYDIDYWLMQHGFFKGGTDPVNYTGILKLVAQNQGMMADTNATAFNALLKLADQASQPRPSFTSQITTTLNHPATLAANINGPAALSVSGKQVVTMWVVDNQGVKTLYSQGGQLNTPNGKITWQGQPTTNP